MKIKQVLDYFRDINGDTKGAQARWARFLGFTPAYITKIVKDDNGVPEQMQFALECKTRRKTPDNFLISDPKLFR